MWRLVEDFVRRGFRWPAWLAVFASGFMWWISSLPRETLPVAFAVSLAVTFAFGPLMTIANIARPVLYLPVSRQDVWHATWFVSTVFATAVTTLVKFPALLFGLDIRDGGLATIALSTVYDFTAAGSGAALMTFARRPPDVNRSWLVRLLGLAALVAFTVAGLWLVSLSERLPTRWADLSAWNVAAIVAMLGFALAGFLAAPQQAVGSRRVPREIGDGMTPLTRPPLTKGLTRLLLHELRFAGSMAAALGLAFAAIAYLGGQLMDEAPPPTMIEFLRLQRLLIFDGAPVPVRPEPNALMVWYAFFVPSIAPRFPGLVRHLRTLPIGITSLTALFVAWPAITWSLVWGTLVALTTIVAGEPRDLHLALWIQLVALSALVASLSLWFSGRYRWLFHATPIVAILPVFRVWHGAESVFGVVLASGALTAAIIVTRAALARNSTYLPIPPVHLQAQN